MHLIERLLRNAVKEHIDVPLGEYDNRGTAKEAEDTGKVEAKSVVNRDDMEGYLKPLRGIPFRWLVKGSDILSN
jgi:hypothetical protein